MRSGPARPVSMREGRRGPGDPGFSLRERATRTRAPIRRFTRGWIRFAGRADKPCPCVPAGALGEAPRAGRDGATEAGLRTTSSASLANRGERDGGEGLRGPGDPGFSLRERATRTKAPIRRFTRGWIRFAGRADKPCPWRPGERVRRSPRARRDGATDAGLRTTSSASLANRGEPGVKRQRALTTGGLPLRSENPGSPAFTLPRPVHHARTR